MTPALGPSAGSFGAWAMMTGGYPAVLAMLSVRDRFWFSSGFFFLLVQQECSMLHSNPHHGTGGNGVYEELRQKESEQRE